MTDTIRLEHLPERLGQIRHLVEEIWRRKAAAYPPVKLSQRRRRARQYLGGRRNPLRQLARYRRRRRG
ncbi:hypothetical protein ACQ4WX_49610 [Streptomyces lasalocidi]